MTAQRLARLSLVVVGVTAAEAFYREALGFACVGREESGVAVLRLGTETVELVAPGQPGAPYPAGSASNDLWFQHFAIVVSDMRAAYGRLRESVDWTPISFGGPVRLPVASGGVTAFKFRDPEGHPLELLEFPGRAAAAELCLGIDHTAIVVADTEASVRYYERLGFAVTARTLNRGLEQERLDALHDPIVEVTALALPEAPSPHLELLCYRQPRGRAAPQRSSFDVANTYTVLDAEQTLRLRDPDGHALLLRPG